MKPRRNDPCPCGSGKKYKKCCMLKEKTSTTSLTLHLLRNTADNVISVLLEYAKKIYGEESMFEAWDSGWAEMAGDFQTDSPFLQMFTPWFVYHWLPDDYDLEAHFPCEHTIVARFLKEYDWKVDNFTKRYLEEAQREPVTFWQVQAVEPEKGMLLKDFITERECFVHEVSGTRIIKKWDIVFGQVIGLDGVYILSATGPYTLPSSRFREHITEFTDRIKRSRGPVVKPVDLLEYDMDFIMCYELCVEELLNPPLPELRNTDGEKLVFTTSRYTFDPANRTDIIAKLDSMRNIEYAGDEDGELEFIWIVEKKKGMMQSITNAHIKIGPDYILSECNSKPRDKRLKNRFLKSLGEWIKYEDTTHKPLDFDELPKSSEESGALDLDTLPEEERQQLVEFIESQYMRWPDQNIPVLQNKTPREAVKTPAGRKQVAALINDWENLQLRKPNPQFRFDFNRLRKTLGLEEE